MFKIYVDQAIVVEQVKGQVFVLMPVGEYFPVKVGDDLAIGTTLLFTDRSEVLVHVDGTNIWLNQHCKACLSNNKLVHLPLPELDLEPSIAALQAAILSGEDPTKIQKATAAGITTAGIKDISSSITDGLVILYDNDQLLATAGFNTAYNPEIRRQDDISLPILSPDGGEFYNDVYFVEGDLVPITYPVSASGSVSVEAATLPLDSNTVAFDSLQIDSLLATMNRELSSNDRPIIFSYDIETNQIIGRSDKGISRSDESIVLTIGLSAELFNGRDANVIMTVTQFLPLDHFAGESNRAPIVINGEQIRLSLPVQIADTNGNLTQTPINFLAVIEDGKIPGLGIDNGTEFTEQDSDITTPQSVTGDIPVFIGSDEIGVMTFAEQQPSLIGLLSNDVATSFAVLGNKITVIRVDDQSPVLAIEVSTNGQYRVTQYQALNQDNALDQTQLSLLLTTTDRDGDISNEGELVIKINDGVDPVLGIDSGTTIIEQDKDIATPQTVLGSIPINVGSDQIKAMFFEPQQPTLDGLLSNSKPTVYRIEGNKIILQLADAPQTEVLTIEINTSGEYSVTQYQALNQPVKTNIDKLTLGVIAIDTDGDKSNVGELNITIVDGPDPILGKDIATSFIETMSPQTFTGQITVDVGSDDIASATFNLEQTTLNGLTSNGQATNYSTVGNKLELFVPAQGSSPKQPVLTVVFEIDGRYTIEQSQPLDQNFTTNVNNLALAVMVTDADGDNSNVGQLIINITDGENPTGAGITAQVSLTEGDLSPKNIADAYPVDASSSFTIPAVNDDLVASSLNISSRVQTELISELEQLTATGLALRFTLTTSSVGLVTLIGKDSTNADVLIVTFSPTQDSHNVTVTMNVEQLKPLDHDPTVYSGGEYVSLTSNGINIRLPLEMHDSDFDPLVEPVNALVILEDGKAPVIESQIKTWTEAFSGTVAEPQSISGQLEFDVNSDVIKQVVIGDITTAFAGLTSDSIALDAKFDDGKSNQIMVFLTGTTTPVLSLSIATDGYYNITQYLPIDQPVTPNTNTISLPFHVVDFDNDSSNDATLTLVITDGQNPTGTNITLETVEGDLALPIREPSTSLYPVESEKTLSIIAANDSLVATSLVILPDVLTALITELSSLTSSDQALEISHIADPITAAQTITAIDSVTKQDVFIITLTPAQMGRDVDVKIAWQQLLPLDHQIDSGGTYVLLNNDKLAIDIPLMMNDGDDDPFSQPAIVTISVEDGADPLFEIDTGTTITDPKKGAVATVAEGEIGLELGSDEIKTLTFDSTQTGLIGWLSNSAPTYVEVLGNELNIRLSSDDSVVLNVVIELDGKYTVTQHLPLNQPIVSNEDRLTLAVTAQDYDGDKAQGELLIIVKDGVDPVLGTDTGTDYTEIMTTQIEQGHIPVDVGSDDIANAYFAIEQPSLAGLTSNAEATDYRFNGNVLQLYVPAIGSTPEQNVLTITLDINGSYTVEQNRPLDQNFTTNVNNLALDVFVVDKDGDDSNIGQLIVDINDGENPTGQGVIAELDIIEGDLNPPVGGQGYPVSSSSNFVVTAVNDALVASSLNLTDAVFFKLGAELLKLTTGGKGVRFDITNALSGLMTLEVKEASNSAEVFELVLTPIQQDDDVKVEMTLTQFQPLDHDPSHFVSGEYISLDDGKIDITIPIIMHDTDFDQLVDPVEVKLVFEDGVIPIINEQSITWTEGFDGAITAPQEVTGSLVYGSHSDEIKQVQFIEPSQAFTGITSNGTALEVVFDPSIPNQFDVQLAGTSTQVLSIAIDPDGQYTIQQYLPIDQPLLPNQNVVNLDVQLMDFDGDKSNVANLQLIIKDGLDPNGINAEFNVVEGDLVPPTIGPSTSGNPVTTSNTTTIPATNDILLADSVLLSSDNITAIKTALEQVTSQGDNTLATIVQDPTSKIISITLTKDNLAQDTIFELTITPSQNGRNVELQSQLVESLPIDHLNGVLTAGVVTMTQANLAIGIPLQMHDADDDPLLNPAIFTVNIADGDLPSFGIDAGTEFTEIDSDSGKIATNIGSDEIIHIDLTALQPNLTHLTSNGYATEYSVVGNTVTVVRQDDPTLEVLTIELLQSGDYNVVQSQPLDQSDTTNKLAITLAVTATDQDLDISPTDGEINITIIDGLDPTGNFTGITDLDVIEGDISAPTGSLTGYPVSDSTTFTLTAGVDRLDPDKVGFSANYLTDLLAELRAEITALGGQTLDYNFDPSTHVLTASYNSQTYFTLTLSAVNVLNSKDADVTVTYEQFLPLDHNSGGNSSGYINVSGALISIDLEVQIQDTDGDYLETPVAVMLNISDGFDPVIINTQDITVEESDIRADGPHHQGSTPDEDGDRATGTLTIDEGSDLVHQYRLDTTQFTTLNSTLTSQGQAVTLFEHSVGTYSAFADSRTIFTVAFTAAGEYTVNLFGAIDHPDPGKDSKDVFLPVIAIDDDGDESTFSTIKLTIVDDIADGRNIIIQADEGQANVVGESLLTQALEGADGATVVSVVDLAVEQPLVGNGFTVIPIHQGGDTISPGQLLGELSIKPNGEVSFSAATEITQTDEVLEYTFNYRVTDGDDDTELRTITLQIDDQEAKIIIEPDPIVTYEDVGRVEDPDETIIAPPSGAPVSLKIDIGDDDRGEFLQQVLITIPTEVHGSFYLNGTTLATSGDGLSYVVPVGDFTTTDNVVHELVGLTFIPDADFSTANGNLVFEVKAQVGVTSGAPLPEAITSFEIIVEGIADIPTWDDTQTQVHYTIDEDSTGVDLQLKADLNDIDGSETLSYIITLEPDAGGKINGELKGNNLVDLGGDQYQVSAADVGSLSVTPTANYSGDIKLTAVAQSKEDVVFVTGKQTADSVEREIIINVEPVADETTLKVTRISSDEDVLINLSDHVTLTETVDKDGSEIECVRFSNLPVGAQILLNGAVVVESPSGSGVYEVNYADIANVQLKPTPESNVDFEITVQGVVKDSASFTNSSNVVVNANDEYVTATQQLEVSLKGVADVPIFDIDIDSNGNGVLDVGEWAYINNDPTQGIETLIDEDSSVISGISIISGETPLKQLDDNSETLSVVLSCIPAGVTLKDAEGNDQSLVFTGYDTEGKPVYEIELSSLKNIEIIPPLNSTQDIELEAKILVTENDGDVHSFDRKILINIQPVIDADNYTLVSDNNILEDQNNTVQWRPTAAQGFTDSSETITQIRFGGIPSDYTLLIDGIPLTLVAGEITLTDSQRDELLAGKPLQLRAPQNSDRDLTFQSYLTVAQTDSDGENTAIKEITGQLVVDIQAVVEPDGILAVRDSSDAVLTMLTSTTGGVIDLSTDAASLGRVSFTGENTPVAIDHSDEVIRRIVVKFPQSVAEPGDFVVIGGISDGAGAWTIPESQLDNLKITAPTGFNSTIDITISAEVQDLGDNGEGDVSALVPFTTPITLDFTPNTSMITELAGDIVFNPDVVTGTEDNVINLGDQIEDNIVIGSVNGEQNHDSVTIVIKAADLPSGVTILGTNFDFIDGEYVMIVPVDGAGKVDVSGISLNPATDFAGDFQFDLHIVNTDTTSGNTKNLIKPVTVRIEPVVDVPPHGDPTLSLEVLRTENLGDDDQPITNTGKPEVIKNNHAYEDGSVILGISASLKDISTSLTSGLESLKQVELTVDASQGSFIQTDGTAVQTITVNKTELDNIPFQPVKDFSGNVSISAVATVEDDVTYTLTTPATAQATGTFTATVDFDVIPVDDPVKFTGVDTTIKGNEDQAGGISLGSISFDVGDTDGSEQIISAKITNVPDGFVLTGPVGNLGNGEWSVTLPVGMQTGSLTGVNIVPAENYSGTLALGVLVFTKEDLLDDIAQNTATINVDILPVGDKIDSDVTTSYTGQEDQPITLTLDLAVRDNTDSIVPSHSNATENSPEKLHVVVTDVPDSSLFDAPVGGSAEKQPDGSWIIISGGTTLDTLVFHPGDANGNFTMNFDMRSSDNGVLATNSLAVIQTLSFDVAAVNDAPVNTLPAGISAEEDIGVIISGISVKDVDATEDNGNMTVNLSVNHGALNVLSTTGVTVDNNNTSDVMLTGKLDDLNAALAAGIHYQSDPNFYGDDTLSMLTNDNGNSGSGGAKTDSTQTSITVAPKPDVPIIELDRPQTSSIHTVLGTMLPLIGIMASVVNPAPNELSIVVSGLNDGDLVDSNGTIVGDLMAAGTYRVPVSQLDDLYLTGLSTGSTSLIVEAESTIDSNSVLSATSITLNINVGEDTTTEIDASISPSGRGELIVDDDQDRTLIGSDDDDIFYAGGGNDILTGNAGDDLFIWELDNIDGSIDVITDFALGEDKIDLTDVLDDSAGDGLKLDDLLAGISADASSGKLELMITASNSNTQTITLDNIQAADLGLASSASSTQLVTELFNQSGFTTS
ncbi:retention module-containing protein [Photobacterium sp. GB-50]|uniref:retention module-containing protein n=1 Tax=Photobacterium sp. GB-50 TaxID=2022107 RepID=UPI0011B27B75|nr:retention module-containing protein [Photobacterium sp. GB-50]